MELMLVLIKQLLSKLDLDLDLSSLKVTLVPENQAGDIAMNCFSLNPKIKPNDLAIKISQQLNQLINQQTDSVFKKVVSIGPYVNFFLSTSYLGQIVFSNLESWLSVNNKENKKVLIEYPSQNTHKEFHIGHVRIVAVGNTLVNLYQQFGNKVVCVNYVNDFGAHVAKILWYLKMIEKIDLENLVVEDKQKWLGQMYVKASQYLAEHPEAKQEVSQVQQALEKHDSEWWKLFDMTRQWSIYGFKQILNELKVNHQAIIYESELKKRGQEIVDELLDRGIAEKGEGGAIIVNLEKYNLKTALIRKSDGTGLYLTSDLALAERKFKDFDIDESINLTGKEQNFYFQQLFKILELSGFKFKMTHIGCAIVSLKGVKMSSRQGNIILYTDLRDKLKKYFAVETKKRHSDWSTEKIAEVSFKLALAVLKFTLLKTETNKEIKFDFSEAVSFEGYSAPYILYTIARINSLFNKAGGLLVDNEFDFSLLNLDLEKKILLSISQFKDVLDKAYVNYNPAVLTRYCFDLAKMYNEYYNKITIINDQEVDLTKIRLIFSGQVKKVLTKILEILSIDIIEQM